MTSMKLRDENEKKKRMEDRKNADRTDKAKLRATCKFLTQGTDWICKHGNRSMVKLLLTKIVVELHQMHYREAFRAIIKTVVMADDAAEIKRLTLNIVRGADNVIKEQKSLE